MILGTGCDIVCTSRIKALADKSNSKLFAKILDDQELQMINEVDTQKSILFLAKRFAAKEAFSKALGLGIGRGVNFKDIIVKNDPYGKPYIEKTDHLDRFVKNHFSCKDYSIHLTISDEKEYCIAFCIIEKIYD